MTDLATYRAAAKRMDIFELTVREGDADLMIETAPDNTVAWRIYERGEWIAELDDGTHWMILDRDEHDTRDGHLTLADLESMLREWMSEEYGELHTFGADAEAAFAAAEAEAHGLVNPTVGTAAAYDRLAVALMETRPDLKQMSLDEWLVEHMDSLSQNERRAASAIIDLYHEKV